MANLTSIGLFGARTAANAVARKLTPKPKNNNHDIVVQSQKLAHRDELSDTEKLVASIAALKRNSIFAPTPKPASKPTPTKNNILDFRKS